MPTHPLIEQLEYLKTGRPLGEYIDAQMDALTDKVSDIARSDTVARFPCRLCAGAGFLIQSGKVCRYLPNGAFEPVTLPNGSSVGLATAHTCPRCLGMQFDIEDLAAAYSRQEVAA